LKIGIIGGINIDIEGAPFKKLKYQDSNPGKIRLSYGGVGRNIAENLARLGETAL
jgi:pseudouridine kinase